jgi:hypothetical protein
MISSARCKAVLGRKLGWTPLHGAEWETTFHTEVDAFIKNPHRKREVPKLVKKKLDQTFERIYCNRSCTMNDVYGQLGGIPLSITVDI